MKDKAYKILAESISRFFKTPQYLILFVSDKCWMKCKHCWFNEEWKCENSHGKTLTFEELKKLSESIKKIMFLSITGGEAFGRDDIVEIVNLFTSNRKTKRFQIPTSGFLTSQILTKTERILISNPRIPFRVDVSLDGNEQVHDEVRSCKGSFKNAADTIRELNKLKKKFDWFDVGVITTISSFNEHIVEEMSAIVEEMHPDGEWMVNIVRGKARDARAGDVDIANYDMAQELIRMKRERNAAGNHSGHFSAKWLSAKNVVRRKMISDIVQNKREGGACTAASFGGVIFADGSVYPCEMLDKSFGNLRDHNFDLTKMWNSSNGTEIRRWIQDNKCICTQECFLSTNILIQPQLWPSLIYERLKLK